jgi:hypothetical protein
MNKYFFLIFALLPLFSFGQKNIPVGQGVLKIDFAKLPTLQFYSDTNLAAPSRTINITKNQSEEYIIPHQTEDNTWFKPEQLFFEYDIFLIRVDTVVGNWYKIVTNSATGEMLWTKADTVKQFIKWQTFLLKSISSVDKGDFNLDIKTLPSDKGTTIKKIESTDCFKVLEVKGDWIKIKTNTELECSESKKPVKSGWIRWRQNNRLTIGYALTS